MLGQPPAETAASAASRLYRGCAAVCRRLDEPLSGTAPAAAVGWLLIEHPGPWPAYGLPADISAPLAEFSRAALPHGVRTQLIRRPDRTGRQPESPVVMLAGGPADARWLERRTMTDAAPFLGLDPAAVATMWAPGLGESVKGALLVCTHGRREVCCAKFGRPVAQALAERFGPLAWETTHVGGDRFAANLVVLPSGAYFGRLDPDDALRAAESALRDHLDLDRYRGTAGLPEATQAAEYLLRRALGATGIRAVRYLGECGGDRADESPSSPALAAGRHIVRFDVEGVGVRVVTIDRHKATWPRLTSCGAGTVETPPGYRLVNIRDDAEVSTGIDVSTGAETPTGARVSATASA
ncbi:MAG: sucrase ferredoxin [Actinocrinis sp.]